MKFLLENLGFQQVTCSTCSTARIALGFGYDMYVPVLWSTMVFSHVAMRNTASYALYFEGGG
jgi:hypothetical protein